MIDKPSLGQIDFLVEALKDNKISEVIDIKDPWTKLENITMGQKGLIYHLMNTPSERSGLIKFLEGLGFKKK